LWVYNNLVHTATSWTLILGFLAATSSIRAEEPSISEAITRGLKRVEQGSESYTTHRQCFSCHHQAMALQSLAAARRHGIDPAPKAVSHQIAFTLEYFKPKLDVIAQGKWMPGGNTMAAYALVSLQEAGSTDIATVTALVKYLLVRQRQDGSWPALTPRPPSEGSTFTNNALAIRGLKGFGPGHNEQEKKDLAGAINKGRDWLVQNQPVTTEDKAFRLRGLVEAAADHKEIDSARQLLLKEQLPEGSWAQLSDRPGDAYATGLVLVALQEAGIKPDAPAHQKAVHYLLTTQHSAGGWLVTTRSPPLQTFFDNGDPGGKSQFISQAATGWAVLALLPALPPKAATEGQTLRR
jgi:N-acyl-D-amino-acid deacylase